MKKSSAITLVLISSTLLLACERDMRNQYNSWDDCVKDYQDRSKCHTETQTGGYAHYYGPWYRSSQAYSHQSNPSVMTHRASGVARGGFGFFGSHAGS